MPQSKTPETDAIEDEAIAQFKLDLQRMNEGAACAVLASTAFQKARKSEQQRDQARAAHKLQSENYIKLYNAVLGDGCFVGEVDPFKMAKNHREECDSLREELEHQKMLKEQIRVARCGV